MISRQRLRLAWHRKRSRHYFISFPKCGRTWTKTVVERYLQRLHGLPPFTFEETAPWIRGGRRRKVPRLVFLHPFTREPRPEATARLRRRLADRRVVLMTRDPRDVVYSYYFRLTRRFADPRAQTLTIPQFVLDPVFGVGRIVDFMNDWHGSLAGFPQALLLRYEDVRREPLPQIGRLLAFLGIPVDDDLLAEVIAQTPDQTTRGLESAAENDTDGGIDWTRPAIEAILDLDDLARVEAQLARLDPALGYRTRSAAGDPGP